MQASAFLLKVGAVPEKNQVFHVYSTSLEPPIINGDTLMLKYSIKNEHIDKKIAKNDTEVYLYDEILSRVQKCLCELEYCRKYSQGFIRISCISVSIMVWDDRGRNYIYNDSFKLRLGGYPDIKSYNLKECCINSNIRAANAIELISILKKGGE